MTTTQEQEPTPEPTQEQEPTPEPLEQVPITRSKKELKKQIRLKDEEIARLNKRIKHIKREFQNILNQIPYNEENRIARQLMARQIALI